MYGLLYAGADDDGSGVVTVLETLRAIVESQVILNRTIEFIFYAAHEQGCVKRFKLPLIQEGKCEIHLAFHNYC